MNGDWTVRLRAAVAVLMLAGFYVLGAALVAGLAWLAVLLLLADPGSPDAQAGAVALGLLVVALLVPGWALLRAASPPPAEGAAVDEAAAPGLWAQTRELAELAGTRPPDEIRLVAAVNAYVWQETGALGLRGGRRILFVGVPLLRAWPVSRLRAVLAHELAHYSHRHTGFAEITYRGMQAMIRTAAAAGPAGIVLTGYAVGYAAVSSSVRRRTELEADDAAARAAGADALAAALADLPALSATWDLLIASYARWARTEGYEPEDVLMRFARDPRLAPPRPAAAGAFDSHPPLAERVARLAGRPSGSVADEPPATALLADPSTLTAALRTRDFDDLVEAAARGEAKLDAARLRRADGLDDAVNLLAAGEGTTAPPVTWGGGYTESLTTADYIVAAVVAAGHARYVHAWSRPLRLEPASVAAAVRDAAADPAAVPELVDMLAGFGLVQRPNSPLPLGALSGEGRLADAVFDLSFAPGDRRRRVDLQVFPAALGAAVLMDLRRAGRIEIDGNMLTVVDESPAGDAFLDTVLARLAARARRPVHTWLAELGPDVLETVATRRRLAGRYRERSHTHAFNDLAGPRADADGRERVLAALDRGAAIDPSLDLGVLLWATEMAGAVLGRRAVQARFLLGRIGAQDPIARAVRTVAGHDVQLPAGPAVV